MSRQSNKEKEEWDLANKHYYEQLSVNKPRRGEIGISSLSGRPIRAMEVMAFPFIYGVTHSKSAVGFSDTIIGSKAPINQGIFDFYENVQENETNSRSSSVDQESKRLNEFAHRNMGELFCAMTEQIRIGTPSVTLSRGELDKFANDEKFSDIIAHGVFQGHLYGNGDLRIPNNSVDTYWFDNRFAKLWYQKFSEGKTNYVNSIATKGKNIYNWESNSSDSSSNIVSAVVDDGSIFGGFPVTSRNSGGDRRPVSDNPLSPENIERFHEAALEAIGGTNFSEGEMITMKQHLKEKLMIVLCPIKKSTKSVSQFPGFDGTQSQSFQDDAFIRSSSKTQNTTTTTTTTTGSFENRNKKSSGTKQKGYQRENLEEIKEDLIQKGVYAPFTTHEPQGGEKYYFERNPVAEDCKDSSTESEAEIHHNSQYVGWVMFVVVLDPNWSPKVAMKSLMTLSSLKLAEKEANKKTSANGMGRGSNRMTQGRNGRRSNTNDDSQNYFLVDSTHNVHPNHILLRPFNDETWNNFAKCHEINSKMHMGYNTNSVLDQAIMRAQMDARQYENFEEFGNEQQPYNTSLNGRLTDQLREQDISSSGFAAGTLFFQQPEKTFTIKTALAIMQSYGGDVSECQEFVSDIIRDGEVIGKECKFNPKTCYRIPAKEAFWSSEKKEGLSKKYLPWHRNPTNTFFEDQIVKPIPGAKNSAAETNSSYKNLGNLSHVSEAAAREGTNFNVLDKPIWCSLTRQEMKRQKMIKYLKDSRKHEYVRKIGDLMGAREALSKANQNNPHRKSDGSLITITDVNLTQVKMATNKTPGHEYNNLIRQGDMLSPIRELVMSARPSIELCVNTEDIREGSRSASSDIRKGSICNRLDPRRFAVDNNFASYNGPLSEETSISMRRLNNFVYSNTHSEWCKMVKSYELMAAEVLESIVNTPYPILTDGFTAILKYQREEMTRPEISENIHDFHSDALGSYMQRTAYLFRHCKQIATSSGHCLIIWVGSNDFGRQFGTGEPTRFNMLTTGPGASSKSEAAKAVILCLIIGTVLVEDNVSEKSQNVEKDLSDQVRFIDEAGSMMGGGKGGKGSSENQAKIATLKKQSGDGIVTYTVYKKATSIFEGDEPRRNVVVTTLCCRVIIANANEDANGLDEACLSRFLVTMVDRGLLRFNSKEKSKKRGNFVLKDDRILTVSELERLYRKFEDNITGTNLAGLLRLSNNKETPVDTILKYDVSTWEIKNKAAWRRYLMSREGDNAISSNLPDASVEEAMFMNELYGSHGNPFNGIGGSALEKMIKTYQALIFYIWKACYLGLLPTVDTVVAHMVYIRYFGYLKKEAGVTLSNHRSRMRMIIIGRILTIMNAIIQAYGVDGKDLELNLSEFRFEKLFAVKPYLCCQMSQSIMAVTLLSGEYIKPYTSAMLKLIGNDANCCNYPEKEVYLTEKLKTWDELVYIAQTLNPEINKDAIYAICRAMEYVTDNKHKMSEREEPRWFIKMRKELAKFSMISAFSDKISVMDLNSLHLKVKSLLNSIKVSDESDGGDDDGDYYHNEAGEGIEYEEQEGNLLDINMRSNGNPRINLGNLKGLSGLSQESAAKKIAKRSELKTFQNDIPQQLSDEEEILDDVAIAAKSSDEESGEKEEIYDNRDVVDLTENFDYCQEQQQQGSPNNKENDEVVELNEKYFVYYALMQRILQGKLFPHEWFLYFQHQGNTNSRHIAWENYAEYDDRNEIDKEDEQYEDNNNNNNKDERGEGELDLNETGGMADGRKKSGSDFFSSRKRNFNNNERGRDRESNNRRSSFRPVRYYNLNYVSTQKVSVFDLATAVSIHWKSIGPTPMAIKEIIEELRSIQITVPFSYSPRLTAAQIAATAGKTVDELIRSGVMIENQSYYLIRDEHGRKYNPTIYLLVPGIDHTPDFRTYMENAIRSLVHKGMKPMRFTWGSMSNSSRGTLDCTTITQEDIDKCNRYFSVPTGSYLTPKERSVLWSNSIEHYENLLKERKMLYDRFKNRSGSDSQIENYDGTFENEECRILNPALEDIPTDKEEDLEDDLEDIEIRSKPPSTNHSVQEDVGEYETKKWEKLMEDVSELGDAFSKSNMLVIPGSLDEWAMEQYFLNNGIPIGPHPLNNTKLCWYYRKKDSFPTAQYETERLKKEHEKIEYRDLPTTYNQRMRTLYYILVHDKVKLTRCLKYSDLTPALIQEVIDHYKEVVPESVILKNLEEISDESDHNNNSQTQRSSNKTTDSLKSIDLTQNPSQLSDNNNRNITNDNEGVMFSSNPSYVDGISDVEDYEGDDEEDHDEEYYENGDDGEIFNHQDYYNQNDKPMSLKRNTREDKMDTDDSNQHHPKRYKLLHQSSENVDSEEDLITNFGQLTTHDILSSHSNNSNKPELEIGKKGKEFERYDNESDKDREENEDIQDLEFS